MCCLLSLLEEQKIKLVSCSTRLIWSENCSGLNAIRYPSWDKVGVGQITFFLSFFIHFLHLRLNFVHEVAVIFVDKIVSFDFLKVVAVVK